MTLSKAAEDTIRRRIAAHRVVTDQPPSDYVAELHAQLDEWIATHPEHWPVTR